MLRLDSVSPAIRAEIYSRYCAILRPPERELIEDWAREQIQMDSTSPIAGPYEIENSESLREPLRAFQNEETRMVTTLGPNQGGRTKVMEVACLWSIVNRPGPMQWNTITDDKAGDFAEERWWPMAKECPDVLNKLPAGGTGLGRARHQERKQKVIFSDGMPLKIQGCSLSNLEEKSIKTQFNDECYQWPVGRLDVAWKRCKISYAWNYKIWNGSVAGIDGDDIHKTFQAGTMEEWHWRCLKCGRKQIPKWGQPKVRGGVKWETDATTKPKNREWDYDAVKKTVRYECEHCKTDFADTSAVRRALNASALYRQMQPLASQLHRSFRYNILTVNWPGLMWGQAVEEFLRAMDQLGRYRNLEPLKGFWTRLMTEPWDESRHAYATRKTIISDYNLGSDNPYKTKKWEREAFRFLSVDKQEWGYPFVGRAVAENGDCRLIDRGVSELDCLESYAAIDAKAKELGIQPKCVLIDCRFETREVYAMAAKYGWTCMMGVDREVFIHMKERQNPQTGQPEKIKIELPYSELKWSDPFTGTKQQTINRRFVRTRQLPQLARRIDWSNLHIKNLLDAFRKGQAIQFDIPGDVGPDYIRQMNAEVRHRIVDKKGRITEFWSNRTATGGGTARPNHAWDIECQIIVAMAAQGLIDLSNWQAAPGIAGDTEQ